MNINFQDLPHEGIRKLVPYKPGKAIEELAREKGITDIIKLASNENPLGCSPKALAELRALSPYTLATYPSPLNHPLMERLAAKHQVSEAQVFLRNGSDFIYTLLLNAYALHQNKHILTHDYAFSTYAIQARTLNIPVRSAAIHADWSVNIDNLLAQCDEQTALVFIANPNNPTGILSNAQDIERLLHGLPKHTILVLDEAYHEYAAKEFAANSIDWLSNYPNLIITRTFSKIYGLAGLRLGYALAHPDIISILKRIQLPFTVNQAALAAGYAALSDEDFLHRSLLLNTEGIAQMRKGLDELNIEYLQSACNFLTCNACEDTSRLYNFLLDKGIIIRPLHAYAMDNYFRVSIGTQEQNTRFLCALHEYYN